MEEAEQVGKATGIFLYEGSLFIVSPVDFTGLFSISCDYCCFDDKEEEECFLGIPCYITGNLTIKKLERLSEDG